jgi:hypothetical protein
MWADRTLQEVLKQDTNYSEESRTGFRQEVQKQINMKRKRKLMIERKVLMMLCNRHIPIKVKKCKENINCVQESNVYVKGLPINVFRMLREFPLASQPAYLIGTDIG